MVDTESDVATALSAGPWLANSESKEGGGGTSVESVRGQDGGGGGSGQEWSSLDGEGRVVAGGVRMGRMVVVGRGREG